MSTSRAARTIGASSERLPNRATRIGGPKASAIVPGRATRRGDSWSFESSSILDTMSPEGSTHPTALPRAGQILTGKYELLRLLGEGGMAFVYEAMHLRLKQRVAIKLLSPDMARDDELGRRFEA